MNKQHLRLKDFRNSLKFSQIQMVEFLSKFIDGVSTPNYSKMESGTRPIPLDYIHILHMEKGLSYEWYFHGKGARKINLEKERLTITDIGELKSKYELLTHKLQSMEESFRKLYADFYASKS